MIGKPEWFTYRQFGWGISPRTWQGWVYVGLLAFILGFTFSIATINPAIKWIAVIIIAITIIDVMHIMLLLPKVHDERENYHQLLIERNCSFAAILSIIMIAISQSYGIDLLKSHILVPFDASLIFVLISMVLTKAISTIYVRKFL